MSSKNKGCAGQIELFDFLEQLDKKVYEMDIRGLCDDGYCPRCGHSFDEFKECDCERCPECGVRISWERWHKVNDDWWLHREGAKSEDTKRDC